MRKGVGPFGVEWKTIGQLGPWFTEAPPPEEHITVAEGSADDIRNTIETIHLIETTLARSIVQRFRCTRCRAGAGEPCRTSNGETYRVIAGRNWGAHTPRQDRMINVCNGDWLVGEARVSLQVGAVREASIYLKRSKLFRLLQDHPLMANVAARQLATNLAACRFLEDCAAVSDPGGEAFCANRVWYGRPANSRREKIVGLRSRLKSLVGWHGRAGWRTEEHYTALYQAGYDALPLCRHEDGGCY